MSQPNFAINRILFFILFLCAAYWAVSSSTDPDLWGHTKYGLDMLEQEKLLRNDIYSYSVPGAQWTNHEWLSEIIFGAVYKYSGFRGMLILKTVLGLLIAFFIYKIISLNVRHVFEVAVLFLLIMFLMSSYVIVLRPQNFSHLFVLMYVYIFNKICLSQRGKVPFSLLCCFPLIMILWVNLHGGFLAGLGLLIIFLVGYGLDEKHLDVSILYIVLITIICTFINPYGYKLYSYLYNDLIVPRISIVEWECLDPSFIIQWIYIGICILVLVLSNKKKKTTQLLLFFVTLYLGFRYIKFFPFFVISTAMVIPSFTEDLLRNQYKIISEHPEPLTKGGKIILICAFSVLLITITGEIAHKFIHPFPVEKNYYPVGAVEYMKKNNIKGNLLVNFNWAQYAIWSLYPDCKICYDGRHRTVYSFSLEKEYFGFHFIKDDWDKILYSYPPDLILWDTGTANVKLLKEKKEWEEIYSDKTAVLFSRGKKI